MLPIVSSTEPVTIPSLELLNQLKRVLRLSPGAEIILFDGSGNEFKARIVGFEKTGVSVAIYSMQPNRVQPPHETWLFAAIVKKDKFEWIVEKATELGVSHIVPLVTDRTEKQGLNGIRLSKVSIEAAEQSGRGTVPKIHDILKLADALATYSVHSAIAWEPTAPKFDKNEMHTISSIYIGPEGGWTEGELEQFKKAGVKLASLGPQILRAETAVVAALSQIVF